jgi:hypothetical protein
VDALLQLGVNWGKDQGEYYVSERAAKGASLCESFLLREGVIVQLVGLVPTLVVSVIKEVEDGE